MEILNKIVLCILTFYGLLTLSSILISKMIWKDLIADNVHESSRAKLVYFVLLFYPVFCFLIIKDIWKVEKSDE